MVLGLSGLQCTVHISQGVLALYSSLLYWTYSYSLHNFKWIWQARSIFFSCLLSLSLYSSFILSVSTFQSFRLLSCSERPFLSVCFVPIPLFLFTRSFLHLITCLFRIPELWLSEILFKRFLNFCQKIFVDHWVRICQLFLKPHPGFQLLPLVPWSVITNCLL
jgi:hypothetical protein